MDITRPTGPAEIHLDLLGELKGETVKWAYIQIMLLFSNIRPLSSCPGRSPTTLVPNKWILEIRVTH